MDGEAPGRVGRQHPEGRDLRGRNSPDAWAHRGGGGGVAREVSLGGRECPPESPEGR